MYAIRSYYAFVDEALEQRHSDLLFEARVAGSPALLYLLFEHQSTPCADMALRLLRYMLRIWERWQRDHPRESGLPPVVPLVLYHGETRWTAPLHLRDTLRLPEAARAVFAPYCPDFEVCFSDLSLFPEEKLWGTALVRMMLALMKHHEEGDLGRHLGRWGGAFP